MPSGAIVNGVLVHHDGAGTVIGIDPDSGRSLFRRQLDGVAMMSAVLPVGNGRFVTNGTAKNAVWELRGNDGTVVWEHDFNPRLSGIGDCPATTDGTRIFCDYLAPVPGHSVISARQPGELHAYALSLANGSQLWDAKLEQGIVPPWNEAAVPLVIGNVLYLGSAIAPWMHALSTSDGHLIWRTQVRGAVKGGVVSDGDTIYFGDFAGYLWALDRHDGHPIGVKNMHTTFNVGSPVLDGRTLIIGTYRGEVLAVPIADIRSSSDP
jgi:outer membrane protein assembly factor BamB